MTPIRMVCTDLDGTLLGKSLRSDDVMAFRMLLMRLRRQHGTVWTIATGRPLSNLQAILMDFLTTGLIPDYLILEDAYIHRRNRRGRFSAFRWWNYKVRRQRTHLATVNHEFISEYRAELMEKFPEAKDRARQAVDLWLEFEQDDKAAEAEDILRNRVHDDAQFYVFRWGRELCLAPSAGTKGEAIKRVASKLRIKRDEIFAVGDGPNDITMLNGTIAGMPASVNNALPQIKDIVTRANGYVCEQEGAKGVVEALNHYSNVCGAATADASRQPHPEPQ